MDEVNLRIALYHNLTPGGSKREAYESAAVYARSTGFIPMSFKCIREFASARQIGSTQFCFHNTMGLGKEDQALYTKTLSVNHNLIAICHSTSTEAK